jgi:F0F1-type ATP synthase membrane subunit a
VAKGVGILEIDFVKLRQEAVGEEPASNQTFTEILAEGLEEVVAIDVTSKTYRIMPLTFTQELVCFMQGVLG